jgi:CubicO group peptidase (beta-lactamase class C family)
MEPGTHYQYVNLNFGIAGAIVERASGIRFDLFVRERIFKHISVGLTEIATFNIFTIQNPANLGACFEGSNGKWVPAVDYYPDGKIP